MGSIHQLSELLYVICLQRLHRADGSLVLIHCVLCALSADIALDNGGKLLKGHLIQITECLDFYYLL